MCKNTVVKSPPVRILDELGQVIRALTRITGGPDDALPLTGTQRLALFELSEAGPTRLNDLAGRMGASAPTASRAIEALVEVGLVQRSPDEHDRRALHLELTEVGRARAAERKERVLEAFRPAVAAMPAADQRQLASLLARLAAALTE
jgi:DNA-binding MarR family transcriptional regulator